MNYLVIRKEKIESLKQKYGQDMVDECFLEASNNHPQIIYWELLKKESNLKDCFKELFQELISD